MPDVVAPPFRRFFPPVLMMATIGFVATDIYLPSFPFIQNDFATSKGLIQFSLSIYLLSFSLSQLVYGPLSDRYGRIKIVKIGLLLSLLGTLLCICAFDISSLLVGRFVQGFGLGAGAVIARAIMRDAYAGTELARFGSFVVMGRSILMASAPFFGGYIQHYMGWRSNFIFVFLYTLLALFSIHSLLKETNKNLNPLALRRETLLEHYLHLFKHPAFIGYALCSSLAFSGLAAYFVTSPYLFEKMIGLTEVEYGYLALVLAAAFGVGGYLNAHLLKYLGRAHILFGGNLLMLLSGIFMLAFSSFLNTYAILIPMIFFSLGASVAIVNSWAGVLHPFEKIAGFAGALYGFIQMFSGALITTVLSIVPESNQIPLSVSLIVIGAAACFFQRLAHKHGH
jgi:Bcr/CflA subfamily drug resistance transporter